jgi:uroporphyrinogen decarboxylase
MVDPANNNDGIHGLVPRDRMAEPARRLRDTYAITPGIPLIKTEFGYYCLERWKEQGMPTDVPMSTLFDYEPVGSHGLGQLGWCEAAFIPAWETKVLEDRGDYELVQDYAGRHVLYFNGRRNGFMPEYVDHPVKDRRTWEEDVKWRLDPTTSARFESLNERMERAQNAARHGYMISQGVIGGYMYLRSLIGPGELPYAWYDMPDVVHDCMKTWFELADAVIARHQEYVTIDELFLAEDICYNHGLLVSPEMMSEFFFPYYQQLIANLKSRQIDRSRHLYVHIDTDGNCYPAIPVYMEHIGMDVMSPMEVAAGCDVVDIGRKYPNLVIKGGIDKRVLAKAPADIDQMLESILPAMRARGGYVPTCDHGVPEEVTLENYRYYRRRAVELGG